MQVTNLDHLKEPLCQNSSCLSPTANHAICQLFILFYTRLQVYFPCESFQFISLSSILCTFLYKTPDSKGILQTWLTVEFISPITLEKTKCIDDVFKIVAHWRGGYLAFK